jgi:hypothetical protein
MSKCKKNIENKPKGWVVTFSKHDVTKWVDAPT